MRFKIRDFRSKLTRNLYEKYFILKKRREKLWNRFLEKGHEKMTIMFIPHDEKKIINFQISKFIIMFFVSLFVFIIITSSYAVIKNKTEQNEITKQILSYKGTKANLVKYEQLTNEISNIIEGLKPDIENVYKLASDTEEIDDLWAFNDFDEKEKLLKNKKAISDDIFSMKKIQTDLTNSANIIKTVENFITERNKIMNQMPSLDPVDRKVGHITSLFGWRRSPFGHGRDFHTGVDIASSPGTQIRSTAPGQVVFSGWMGGYGKAVKIKHKYGYETIYGHMSATNIGVGPDVIKAGTVVGFVGMTGNATGNHCHYEIRLGDVAINPYPYMSR